ncbi:MAG: peptidylprolyl isomerase [Dehalococcoidia bacterium]|nr:peptidylprolyl isomerase [Dehalococcoidia bacterium]MDP6782420.1 peptidylprolyl isomerase [Dehalococcoidia bacterium]
MKPKKQRQQRPVHVSAIHLSRLAQQRKRQQITLLAGVVAIVAVLATVGFGYLYTRVLPQWETVATVNGTPISSTYFSKLLRLAAGPSSTSPSVLASLVLQQAIDNEIVLQQAPALGLSITPIEIEEYLQIPAEPNTEGGLASFEESYRKYLWQVGFTSGELRRVVEADLLRKKAFDYFQKQAPQEAEQVNLSYILVETDLEAFQVLERLEAGEEFATLAQELSMDTATVDSGGEVGWVTRDALDFPEMADAVFSLDTGKASQPIATPDGYYIAKVEGHEVRDLEAIYRDQLASEAWQAWLDGQRESSQIEENLSPRRMSWATSWASR